MHDTCLVHSSGNTMRYRYGQGDTYSRGDVVKGEPIQGSSAGRGSSMAVLSQSSSTNGISKSVDVPDASTADTIRDGGNCVTIAQLFGLAIELNKRGLEESLNEKRWDAFASQIQARFSVNVPGWVWEQIFADHCVWVTSKAIRLLVRQFANTKPLTKTNDSGKLLYRLEAPMASWINNTVRHNFTGNYELILRRLEVGGFPVRDSVDWITRCRGIADELKWTPLVVELQIDWLVKVVRTHGQRGRTIMPKTSALYQLLEAYDCFLKRGDSNQVVASAIRVHGCPKTMMAKRPHEEIDGNQDGVCYAVKKTSEHEHKRHKEAHQRMASDVRSPATKYPASSTPSQFVNHIQRASAARRQVQPIRWIRGGGGTSNVTDDTPAVKSGGQVAATCERPLPDSSTATIDKELQPSLHRADENGKRIESLAMAWDRAHRILCAKLQSRLYIVGASGESVAEQLTELVKALECVIRLTPRGDARETVLDGLRGMNAAIDQLPDAHDVPEVLAPHLSIGTVDDSTLPVSRDAIEQMERRISARIESVMSAAQAQNLKLNQLDRRIAIAKTKIEGRLAKATCALEDMSTNGMDCQGRVVTQGVDRATAWLEFCKSLTVFRNGVLVRALVWRKKTSQQLSDSMMAILKTEMAELPFELTQMERAVIQFRERTAVSLHRVRRNLTANTAALAQLEEDYAEGYTYRKRIVRLEIEEDHAAINRKKEDVRAVVSSLHRAKHLQCRLRSEYLGHCFSV